MPLPRIIYEKWIKKKQARYHTCIHRNDSNRIPGAALGYRAPNSRDRHDFNEVEAKENGKTVPHLLDSTAVCDICREEQKAMKRYRWRLMIGLFFPFLLQSLDLTIIAGALPFIASDFRRAPPFQRKTFRDSRANRSTVTIKLDCLSIQFDLSSLHSLLGTIR
jgi:hypothetical protein